MEVDHIVKGGQDSGYCLDLAGRILAAIEKHYEAGNLLAVNPHTECLFVTQLEQWSKELDWLKSKVA